MPSDINTQTQGLIEEVLTKEQQDQLTPEAVIDLLMAGNTRFVDGELTLRNHVAQVRNAALNQFPKAVVLSCVDSRVPVEDVFDRGIGDIFVARVAGNFVNTDILGSMEFACKVAGAKLVLVMGHEHCGAVKGAIDKVELGNITSMVANITPAVDAAHEFDGEQSSANVDFVTAVAGNNVSLTVQKIRDESPLLAELEAEGAIRIVGAMYSMGTGQVELLDPDTANH